mmetsp:Transcript_51500/g.156530  ORF Transcript_51500/g.156530 Transcript_51500/m.156530 type:complete len:204 (-) Transcript_51500:229-840(-)
MSSYRGARMIGTGVGGVLRSCRLSMAPMPSPWAYVLAWTRTVLPSICTNGHRRTGCFFVDSGPASVLVPRNQSGVSPDTAVIWMSRASTSPSSPYPLWSLALCIVHAHEFFCFWSASLAISACPQGWYQPCFAGSYSAADVRGRRSRGPCEAPPAGTGLEDVLGRVKRSSSPQAPPEAVCRIRIESVSLSWYSRPREARRSRS